MLTNPSEMFNYLFNKDIGTDWALFYESRALVQETMGKYKDAEESFKIGVNRKAFPVEKLKQSYELFTERMQERVAILKKKREERGHESSSRTSSRSERTSSSRGLSHIRVPGNMQSQTLSYSTMPQVALPTLPNQTISILRDENISTKDKPVNDIKIEWNEFSTEAESMKENIQLATAWSGKTLPQKKSYKSAAPSFAIYIDPECEEQPTPNDDTTSNKPAEDLDDDDLMKMLASIKKRIKSTN